MLGRVRAPLPRSLTIALVAALAVHVPLALVAFHARGFQAVEWRQNLLWLALAFGVAGLGRLVLAFFPPGGEAGVAAWPATWATSLALGWLTACVGAMPLGIRSLGFLEHGTEAVPVVPSALALLAIAMLFVTRWVTLPGAMVPRHAVAAEDFGRVRPLLILAALAWLGYTALTRNFVGALAWLALGILLERGLHQARRAASGRALFLCAFVPLGQGSLEGLTEAYGVALAFGAGAAFLIPWLRRADKRAGLLAATFLSAPLLVEHDPLAVVGVLTFLWTAHRPQRRFAGVASAATALPFALVGWLLPGQSRGRGLLLEEFEDFVHQVDWEAWALAWPLVGIALVLGAFSFRWSPVPWQPGTIEPPRREALALVGLTLLACAALALPMSPWPASDVLVILFPLLALLAGLLLIPAERAPLPDDSG